MIGIADEFRIIAAAKIDKRQKLNNKLSISVYRYNIFFHYLFFRNKNRTNS